MPGTEPHPSDWPTAGALAPVARVARSCEICGSPAEGLGRICSSCSELAGYEAAGEATAVMAPVARARPAASARPAGRGRFYAMVATVVLLFAGAGGAGAYFLAVADETRPNTSDEASSQRPSAGDAAAEDEASEASPGAGEASEHSAEAPTEGTNEPGPDEPRQAPAEGPEEVLRSHYAAITEGDYERAFGVFHPTYKADRAGMTWIADRQQGRPKFDLETIEIDRASQTGDVALLNVGLVVSDTAGSDQVCRHFRFMAQMENVGGEWTYRPPLGNSSPRELPIGASDERCARVSG